MHPSGTFESKWARGISPARSKHQPCTQENKRGVEEERVDAIEHAAVAGEEPSGVLGAEGALEERFGEVADRAEHGRARADEGGAPRREGRDPEVLHDQRADDAAGRSAERSLERLAGRDALVQLALSERA